MQLIVLSRLLYYGSGCQLGMSKLATRPGRNCGITRTMLTRLDHLVILVLDLDRAAGDYEDLGFAVTPGGTHADGLTRNALIPFRDGSYLELASFLDPSETRENVWGWRRFVATGGGLIDHCAASDDLLAEVRRLGDEGFEVEGPDDGGRRLPDGEEIRWRSAHIRQRGGRTLPFLIEDLTPRELRVPGGPATKHPNGAVGISRLEVAVPDARRAARSYAVLLGGHPPEPPELPLRLGSCTLAMVGLASSAGEEARRRLETVGPGPLAVELAAAEGTGELDRRSTHGARIRLE
jgi:Glyoxalase-like domain